jgi:hypothetical protein
MSKQSTQNKIDKLSETRMKWEGIFEKSETARNARIADLEKKIAKQKEDADRIAAKKNRLMTSFDERMVKLVAELNAPETTETTEKTGGKDEAGSADEAAIMAELEKGE